MKLALRLIFLAAVVGAGIWLWTVFFPSPERAVRNQLTKLANDVSFAQDQNNLIKVAHAESVSSFFTTNVEVTVNVPGHHEHSFAGRAEITQAALESRQAARWLSVRFPDVNVSVAPDRQSATADVTAEVKVSGEADPIVQELKFTFEKNGRQWLIHKVQTVQPVSILNFDRPALRFIMAG
ncbi:MAG TPA: hypothetical protein VFV81_07585 [Verrucomicrobiae bacterium]|nr:hypothetical protein [Verrucomicrobiae bacterium]